jgi:hypothetical protein
VTTQPTRSIGTIQSVAGPLAAAAHIAAEFPGLPAGTIEAHPQWGVTVYLHNSTVADYERWVAALYLVGDEPKDITAGGDPFRYLHATGSYAEIPLQVRAYVPLPEPLPSRGVDAAAEVALLGLWLDAYGDQKRWSQDLRMAYAEAVAKQRAERRTGGAQ